MCIKYFLKHLAAISILFGMISAPLCANAGTEYGIGLTAQGIRNASLEEIEVGFNYQLANQNKNKDYAVKIKVYPTVNQLSDAINSKKVIGYFGPPLMFLKHKNMFDADLLFSPVLSDKVMQRYVILVRKDAGLDKVEKLKNATLSFCETDEVGIFFLQKLLQDKKLGILESYFSKTVIKKNPSLAISALFFKETQATIVLESDFTVAAELNPQLSKQLVAIETSPEYLTNLLAIRKDIEGPMTKQDFEASAMALSGAVKSKKMLKNYNYGALRKIKPQELNSVTDLINSLNKSKGGFDD